MNIGGNMNYSQTPAFVNNIRNQTDNFGYSIRPNLNFTPNPKLIVGAGFDFNYTDVQYSIQTQQNQKITSYKTDLSVKWQVIPKTFFEGNFNYSKYENRSFDFEQSIPLLNASVRRLLGKSNKVEVRLAAFDILNRRVSINQFATQNYTTNSVTNTLARYFMLSLSYNVRGYEGNLKKNNWW